MHCRFHSLLAAGTLAVLAGCGSGGLIEGRVVINGTTDASGVAVTLAGPSHAATVTGSTGSFRFAGLPDGRYAVVVNAPATVEGTIAVAVDVRGSSVADAGRLELEATGRIEGMVRAATGSTGIDGTLVVVAGTSSMAEVDAGGNYVLDGVPAGAQTIVATAPDGSGAHADVDVRYAKTASAPTLTLAPLTASAGRIEGRVVMPGVSSAWGVPVTVSGAAFAATATDVDGHYDVGGLPDGSYVVTASAASTVEGTVRESVMVTGGAAVTAPDLVLDPLGSVSGLATLGDAPSESAGIAILVHGVGGQAVGVTDASGHYAIPGSPLGPVVVEAVRAGYQVATTPAGPVGYGATTTAPSLVLAPDASGAASLATVRGSVSVLGSNDAGGVTAMVVNSNGALPPASSSADGTYAISGVPAGDYELDLSFGEYQAIIPNLVALPGSDGYLLADHLYPLLPIEIQRGRQIAEAEEIGWVHVSPDGSHVAFLAQVAPQADPTQRTGSLMVAATANGTATEVAQNVCVDGVQIAPDGRHVLFFETPYAACDGADELFSAPIDGGAPTKLSDTAWQSPLAFSPDGMRVLLTSVDGTIPWGTLYEAPVAGGSAIQLATNVVAGSARYTPDGKRVLFVEFVGGSLTRFEVMNLADGTTAKLNDVADGHVVLMSPDGSRVYFTDTGSQLSSMPIVAGGPITRLITNIWEAAPVELTADGKHLLCFDMTTIDAPPDGAGLLAVDLATSQHVTLAPSVYFDGVLPTPDGQAVIFATNANGPTEVDVVPIDGGSPRTLATGVVPGAYTLSTGGDRLLVVDHAPGDPPGAAARLEVFDVATGDAVPLARGVDPDARPLLSPDGSRAAFIGDFDPVTGRGTMTMVPAAGGTPIPSVSHATGLWAAGDRVLTVYAGAVPPLGFQDGLYASGWK